MKKNKIRNQPSSRKKTVVSLSLIQRANTVIMGMSRDEIVDSAERSKYLVTGFEINKIYSHVNKTK